MDKEIVERVLAGSHCFSIEFRQIFVKLRGLSHGRYLMRYFIHWRYFRPKITNVWDISHVSAQKVGDISNY